MENSQKQKIFIIKKVIKQKKWTKEEDNQLLNLVKENNGKNWKEISSYFHNKNPLQCFSRYKRIRPELNKGSWKKEEDSLILNLIKTYGNSWSKISKIIKTRNGKQIRDRYNNVLNPNINKNKFSIEEDNLILNLYEKFGTKWSKFISYFNNRTSDMIKNRFHSTLKKKYENNNLNINTINNNKNENIKNNNNNNIIKGNLSTDTSSSNNNNNNNNKEFSTIIKLSYPPSSLPIKLEKEDRKNFEQNNTNNNNNNNNNVFNNEYFEYSFDDNVKYLD